MRTATLFWIIILLLFTACSGQKKYDDYSAGSGFDRERIDSTTLENLTVLGRVWGYVKYHHPVFADSMLNVDYELFELLPQVADAAPETRNGILTDWIDDLGEFTVAREKYESLPSDVIGRQRIDLGWTKDTLRLGAELSDRLARLRYADRKRNYYVTQTHYNAAYYRKNLGKDIEGAEFMCENPGFENELAYPKVSEPDYGYRLLSVFRFWNAVEYFFPSKYLIERPWNDVLPEYIARMATLPDSSYQHTMWRMIAEIKDSHAAAGQNTSQLFGLFYAPITLDFVEDRLIVSAPDTLPIAEERTSPFRVGDEVLAVDGRPAAYYVDRARDYIPASNEERVYANAARIIRYTPLNTRLRIRYRREGVERDTLVGISSYPKPFTNGGASRMIENTRIFYLNPTDYTKADEERFARMLSGAEGFIVDLRCRFADDYNDFVRKYIVPDSISRGNLYTYPVLSLPGTFASGGKIDPKTEPSKGKIAGVVLVDNGTQSTLETHVQWLQSRADIVTVGTRSAGANGNVSWIVLPGGLRTCFSGLGWYDNDGEEIQRRGVRIDYPTPRTIEGVIAGRDEALEKAIGLLTK